MGLGTLGTNYSNLCTISLKIKDNEIFPLMKQTVKGVDAPEVGNVLVG